jgi:hypothetical protein
MKTKFICSRCLLPVVPYFFGWKHHPGPGRKSCGKRPVPIKLVAAREDESRTAG